MPADNPPSEISAPADPPRGRAVWLYLLLFVAVTGGCGLLANFAVWTWSVSACKYPPDRPGFLAYCGQVSFGDYEHGAYAYGWRQEAMEGVRKADVLVLGSSTMQVAFSTDAVRSFFHRLNLPYYLLGFGFGEQYGFAEALFKRYPVHPKVLIINVDPYFSEATSPVGAAVLAGGIAERANYWRKRLFVAIQPILCRIPGFCDGVNPAFYREDATGAWDWKGVWYAADWKIPLGAVPPNPFGPETLQAWSKAADRFVTEIGVDRRCVILTAAPISNYETAPIAQTIGKALGVSVILPHIDGIATLDGSHLSADTAERWSAQFLQMSAAQIERCTQAPAS